MQFQFHDGSIQALPIRVTEASGRLVSIPRWFDSSGDGDERNIRHDHVSIPRWFDSSFRAFPSPTYTGTCFNSTMVRFKHTTLKRIRKIALSFQFHDGSIQAIEPFSVPSGDGFVSIPRWFDSSYAADLRRGTPQNGFNSTMVRFKRHSRLSDGGLLCWFQFHDGSIQAIPTLYSCGHLASFNSTMVRFKHLFMQGQDTFCT